MWIDFAYLVKHRQINLENAAMRECGRELNSYNKPHGG